jgi:transcriptional regulator of nitric oxide reductase
LSAAEIEQARERVAAFGLNAAAMSDADIEALVIERARRFIEDAPTTAAEAATIILDGVKADRWRILVGKDAVRLDELVRQSPERAYDRDFYEALAAEIGWRLGMPPARQSRK